MKERNHHHGIVPSHHFRCAYAPGLAPTVTSNHIDSLVPAYVYRAVCHTGNEISIHGCSSFVESVKLARCDWTIFNKPCRQSTHLRLCTCSIQMAIGREASPQAPHARPGSWALNSSLWANHKRFSHQHCDASKAPQAAYWPVGNTGSQSASTCRAPALGEKSKRTCRFQVTLRRVCNLGVLPHYGQVVV